MRLAAAEYVHCRKAIDALDLSGGNGARNAFPEEKPARLWRWRQVEKDWSSPRRRPTVPAIQGLNAPLEDFSQLDGAGWKSAASGSRLQPEAILDFFQYHLDLQPADCAKHSLENHVIVGSKEAIQAYPSEFQSRRSYTVEIVDTSATDPDALMTLVHYTEEVLDQDQIRTARGAYGDFVPEYSYLGPMSPDHPALFVWRIVYPRGRPFATDAYRLGQRQNHEKYVDILEHFVEFVLTPAGGHLPAALVWPTVPHNDRLDARNIIVRPDWKGIVSVLFWGTPPVRALPWAASLCGLLYLRWTPLPNNKKKKKCRIPRAAWWIVSLSWTFVATRASSSASRMFGLFPWR
ncbi:hypothetical protein JX265_014003 [Neoarthrinium moseri]|uniref:Uncharacterized protein n=1 Tax=Neoarthrinium moseri TaxID=1658444 RepID=A0A9P9W7M3_9PEZI|nr:hypothetical protein JX265_014003 [Neoarthrinium moseri]